MPPGSRSAVFSRAALSQHDAERCAPEMECAEIDVVDRVAAKVAEVPDVASHTDVLREKPHDPGAGIETELVVADLDDVVPDVAGDLRSDEPRADRDVRTYARAVSAADRDADNDVTHQV